jgi:hypothetical protein
VYKELKKVKVNSKMKKKEKEEKQNKVYQQKKRFRILKSIISAVFLIELGSIIILFSPHFVTIFNTPDDIIPLDFTPISVFVIMAALFSFLIWYVIMRKINKDIAYLSLKEEFSKNDQLEAEVLEENVQ